MKLINWINKVTKLNQTTMTTFQNNINAGKVDKTGDTMSGVLKIENKSAFNGVDKVRTIDGVDYTASLGVGSDGSASLELHNASGTLGRIDINKDGKIKNFKTGKYLVEQNTWQTATLNSTYAREGTCKYITIGNALIITISDLKISSSVVHNTTLFSGLPTGKEQVFLVNQYNTTTHKRLKLTSAGNIVDWYDPIPVSESQFYGTTIC